jgi:hypothetical protein
LITAVILSGLQTVSIAHSDGTTLQAIRPLAGMGVTDHRGRVAFRGGVVRVPLMNWTMSPGQEAVVSSRLEIKSLAVLLQSPESAESQRQPPRFRRLMNLEASR